VDLNMSKDEGNKIMVSESSSDGEER